MKQNSYRFEVFNSLTSKERRIKFISEISQENKLDDTRDGQNH